MVRLQHIQICLAILCAVTPARTLHPIVGYSNSVYGKKSLKLSKYYPKIAIFWVCIDKFMISCLLGNDVRNAYVSNEKRGSMMTIEYPSGLSHLDCYQQLANVWMRFLMRKQNKRRYR